jgi:hypothetical protein
VIAAFNEMKGGTRKATADLGQQIETGERVTGALKEQHRKIHPVQVICSSGARLTRSVKWKSQERQASDLG